LFEDDLAQRLPTGSPQGSPNLVQSYTRDDPALQGGAEGLDTPGGLQDLARGLRGRHGEAGRFLQSLLYDLPGEQLRGFASLSRSPFEAPSGPQSASGRLDCGPAGAICDLLSLPGPFLQAAVRLDREPQHDFSFGNSHLNCLLAWYYDATIISPMSLS
jgi:hypothetical protein